MPEQFARASPSRATRLRARAIIGPPAPIAAILNRAEVGGFQLDHVSSLTGLSTAAVEELAEALGVVETDARLDEPSTWWTDLLELVRASADPEAALPRLEQFASSYGATECEPLLRERIANSPHLRRALVAVVAASRSLAAHLRAHPQDVALIETPPKRHIVDDGEATVLALEAAETSGDGLDAAIDAIRLHKRRVYLELAAADLLGIPSLEEVGSTLSALATACIEAALAVITRHLGLTAPPIGVIGMGKLGGGELNYASDIDVMFVSRGRQPDIEQKAAELLVAAIGGKTPVAMIFRVDADLRPEGRAGPLVRSLESFRIYWEKWADTWEFQALLKARPVAGDMALGGEFIDAASSYVWPDVLDPDAIRAIRAMKVRTEQELVRRGVADREVKRGRGGIRDVEFAVQLLQLVHGRHDKSLRLRGTLPALAALADGGYVDRPDAEMLGDAYRFLRRVEHHLQLRDERQVYALPETDDGMEHLARTLGLRSRGNIGAREVFEELYREQTTVVRSIHERLFFRPLLEAFGQSSQAGLSVEAAEERLAAFGFTDIRSARAGLVELTSGLSRASRLMDQLLPLIMGWLADSPDPDLGLTGLRKLVDAVGDKANLVTTFRENATAVQRLCTILGTSRVLGDLIVREPETLATLSEESFEPKSPTEIRDDAMSFISWRPGFDERLGAVHRFHRREFLRMATGDLISNTAAVEIGGGLAALGDSVLQVALDAAIDSVGGPVMDFAILGMGSLGGAEMAYSSDLDVIFIYDGDDAYERAMKVADRLAGAFRGVTAEGIAFRLDADLRPEGRSGPMVRSLESTIQYYRQWAETWEFQAMTKARHVAGTPALTATLLSEIEPLIWPDPFPEERVRQIRMMKARMERDRIPAGEDPKFHLKLGPGGLTDVEFAVQLLALEHGGSHLEVRGRNTRETLIALVEIGAIDAESASRLSDGFEFCTRVRNRLFLIKGRQVDSLPSNPKDATRLGESLGWLESPRSGLREEYRRITRRARAAFEEVFFG